MRGIALCVEFLLEPRSGRESRSQRVTRCLSLSTAVIDGNRISLSFVQGMGAEVNAAFNVECSGFALKYEHIEIAEYLKSHAPRPGELGQAWPGRR